MVTVNNNIGLVAGKILSLLALAVLASFMLVPATGLAADHSASGSLSSPCTKNAKEGGSGVEFTVTGDSEVTVTGTTGMGTLKPRRISRTSLSPCYPQMAPMRHLDKHHLITL